MVPKGGKTNHKKVFVPRHHHVCLVQRRSSLGAVDVVTALASNKLVDIGNNGNNLRRGKNREGGEEPRSLVG